MITNKYSVSLCKLAKTQSLVMQPVVSALQKNLLEKWPIEKELPRFLILNMNYDSEDFETWLDAVEMEFS